MTSAAKQVLTDLSPLLKVYTDGTIERLVVLLKVPPSPADPTTGVATKDAAFSPAVSARLHLPKLTSLTQKLPILLYFHGGGFCIGSAFSALDHRYLHLLSASAAAIVISVGYRLGPEHPLPAAYDDAWAALQWLCSHAASAAAGDQTGLQKDEWIASHGDLSRVFIGGHSAGANIAHNIAMRAGSDPLPGNVKIAGALLSHPYFLGSDPVGDEPRENIEGSLLCRLWLLAYPAAAGGIDNPMINPLAAGAPSLCGLGCSKVMICLAEKDLLTTRSRVYAERLVKSGWKGEVEVVEVHGEDHCFHSFNPQTDKATNLIHRMAAFISE